MTIYERFNKDRGALEIMSDGAYSTREWEFMSYHKNATEARREFYRYKNGWYVPAWTSAVKWTGEY